jgi:hypothetical protein
MYINYMAEARAFANWLIPDYDTRGITGTAYSLPDSFTRILHQYEIQQLRDVWRLDFAGVYKLLNWAAAEIKCHDSSNPQTSFPF